MNKSKVPVITFLFSSKDGFDKEFKECLRALFGREAVKYNPGKKLIKLLHRPKYETLYQEVLSLFYNVIVQSHKDYKKYFPAFVTSFVIDKAGRIYIDIFPSKNDHVFHDLYPYFQEYQNLWFGNFKLIRVMEFEFSLEEARKKRTYLSYALNKNGTIRDLHTSRILGFVDADGGVFRGAYFPNAKQLVELSTLLNFINKFYDKNFFEYALNYIRKHKDLKSSKKSKFRFWERSSNKESRLLEDKLQNLLDLNVAVYALPNLKLDSIYSDLLKIISKDKLEYHDNYVLISHPISVGISELILDNNQHIFVVHPISLDFSKYPEIVSVLDHITTAVHGSDQGTVKFSNLITSIQKLKLKDYPPFFEKESFLEMLVREIK